MWDMCYAHLICLFLRRTRMLNIYCMLFGFVCLCCMDCVSRIYRKGVSAGKDTYSNKTISNYTTPHVVCVRSMYTVCTWAS